MRITDTAMDESLNKKKSILNLKNKINNHVQLKTNKRFYKQIKQTKTNENE